MSTVAPSPAWGLSDGTLGIPVRCFFEGVPIPPDPFDLTFARVPVAGEIVIYREERWVVSRVTWAQEGPFLDLSYVA